MKNRPESTSRIESAFGQFGDDPVRCVVLRGGTSRGVFFHEQDLPRDRAQRDLFVMAALGAPDSRQVDGLGGADMLLSKVAIVSKSTHADADVECEFANMTPGKEKPTWGTNCGNLASAVALFAYDEGIISKDCIDSMVRIRNRNSGGLIEARVKPVSTDMYDYCKLAGMSSTGVHVDMDFMNPVGGVLTRLLPTGNARDTIHLKNGMPVDVTVVDAGALYVLVRAKDLSLSGCESGEHLQRTPSILGDLEFIRAEVASLVGLVKSAGDAVTLSPDVPKLAFVGPALDYKCEGSVAEVKSDGIDLVSRIVSSQNFHKAYAVTGAIATAAAAIIPGSTVYEAIGRSVTPNLYEVRIGHPGGILTCEVKHRTLLEKLQIQRVRLKCTARSIMQGYVCVPKIQQ